MNEPYRVSTHSVHDRHERTGIISVLNKNTQGNLFIFDGLSIFYTTKLRITVCCVHQRLLCVLFQLQPVNKRKQAAASTFL